MIYVTGGICGNYNAYKKLIRTINLKKQDDLYVIGDIIGPFGESFALLEDMSMRENVFPVLGRNEFAALRHMTKISDNSGELIEFVPPLNEPEWLVKLIENFLLVDKDTRAFLIEYLSEMPLYEELTVRGRDYLLVNNESGDFPIDISIDDKTIITLKALDNTSTSTNKIMAICIDTGDKYCV